MKKNFKLAFVVLAAICMGQQVKAQATTPPVTVNIDLTAPVLSIALGGTPNVDFTYATAAEYNAPKTDVKTGHLIVVSNKPYKIEVEAESDFTSVTTPANTTNLPALGLVKVTVDPASLTTNGASNATGSVTLTRAKQQIVNEADASINAIYNVTYGIEDASSLITLPLEKYTTTVKYTATHQ